MSDVTVTPLRELTNEWRTGHGRSHRRAAAAVLAFVAVLALLVARRGTWGARLDAAAAVAASTFVALAWRIGERRRSRRPEALLRGPARSVDPGRADRALRALSLLGSGGAVRDAGTSAELAHAHVARVLADLPSDRIARRSARVAARVTACAVAVGLVALGIVIANAWSVVEGADVLLARHGQAPVAVQWLDDVELTARPPDYLHEPEIRDAAIGPLALPNGTVLTLKGRPLHPGRRLLVSDGINEVPLVEDGASALVATWPLDPGSSPAVGQEEKRRGSVDLKIRISARFGDVAIPEPSALDVTVVLDAPPVVQLQGAPRRMSLAELTEDIPIEYEASDDHGLREVHLVLRSGASEERRVLARLDGETTRDHGGHTLRLRDAFLRKSHAPVEVTVEAKDNDPLTGPKWGASAAITVVPPDIGEPEAQRVDALRKVRDALVDTLAWRMGLEVPAADAKRRAMAAQDAARATSDDAFVDGALSRVYGGLRVPSGVRAMVVAQQQATRKAIAAQSRSPSEVTHAAVVKATERFVLVTDAVVRGMGMRDARESSLRLADVADDLAVGAAQMQSDDAETRGRGGQRMDAAALVLGAGGRAIRRLGNLGWDLGEIVDADLSRVDRSSADLIHAELAARDLAARLRQPDPSFAGGGSRMGLGGRGGTEGAAGASAGQGEPDQVEEAFREAAQELDRLAQDHGAEVAKTEDALAGSANGDEMNRMREEGKRHADAVRAAARALPAMGTGSRSWTSKGAAAREFAEQMARSLEEGRAEEAVESGRGALGSLDGAREMARRESGSDAAARVNDARQRLAAEQTWAEEQLREMRRLMAQRARGQLEQGATGEEKMADRALDLAKRTRESGSLPEQAVESIGDAEHAARQAAQALKRGDAEKGLEQQREAQRSLEAAREQLEASEDDSAAGPNDEADGRPQPSSRPFEWGKQEHKGPEDFRRRVMRGLAQPANGSLKDAVRRYAEGLLR